MYEQMTINLADQWTETTVGNIVESAIFYGKVRLVTPISRLTQLLAQGPQTISLLSRLIDDGHLEIEIEQFPAGELAHELDLLRSDITDILHDGETDVLDAMRKEYQLDERLINKIRVEALAHWDLIDDPDRIREARYLAERLVIPDTTEISFNNKLQRLRNVLLFSKDDLLSDIVRNRGAGAPNELLSVTGEIHKLGIAFPILKTSHFSSASLIEAVSFAGFVFDNMLRESSDDVFTDDRFNQIMLDLYDVKIKSIAGRAEIDTFQSAVLRTEPIRELYDDGQIDVTALMNALDAKEDLLKAVANKPRDINLTQWYFDEKNRDPISGTTIKKSVRFGLFTGAGLGLDLLISGGLGTTVGIALGAFDALILDRFAKRGGPSTYVDGPLRRLVHPR